MRFLLDLVFIGAVVGLCNCNWVCFLCVILGFFPEDHQLQVWGFCNVVLGKLSVLCSLYLL